MTPEQLQALPIAELLPHAGNMMLLDKVLEAGVHHIVVACTLRDDCIYLGDDKRVANYAGIELMSQAIAAFAGLQRRQRGEAARAGFLLGTRSYTASGDSLPLNQTLQISATELYREDNGLAAFDCRLMCGEECLAQARLNVYEPNNLDEYLGSL